MSNPLRPPDRLFDRFPRTRLSPPLPLPPRDRGRQDMLETRPSRLPHRKVLSRRPGLRSRRSCFRKRHLRPLALRRRSRSLTLGEVSGYRRRRRRRASDPLVRLLRLSFQPSRRLLELRLFRSPKLEMRRCRGSSTTSSISCRTYLPDPRTFPTLRLPPPLPSMPPSPHLHLPHLSQRTPLSSKMPKRMTTGNPPLNRPALDLRNSWSSMTRHQSRLPHCDRDPFR